MNNELPLITIVTVTKNRPNLLKRAIETVKQQTYSNINLKYIMAFNKVFFPEILYAIGLFVFGMVVVVIFFG